MALDRKARELVRGLDEHELRQLLILARGRLLGTDGPTFVESATTPKVSYRQRTVRCGKPSCTTCPHGPYWYARWREGDQVRTRYVGKIGPDDTDE